MKVPVTPPDYRAILNDFITTNPDIAVNLVAGEIPPTDNKGRYLHWDKLRHLEPPNKLSNEQWWCGLKFSRNALSQVLPFQDKHNTPFKYCLPPKIQEDLHWLDLNSAGTLSTEKPITNANQRTTYLIKSLVTEAISSSQLEGATTTRDIAKEMLRKGRQPKDKSEQMILNNYKAMQFIREYKEEKLTPSMVLELHKILTDNTLDDATKAGQFRGQDDDINVVDNRDGTILHTPPEAHQLKERLDALCRFASSDSHTGFIHPVIKAIILHFMLAYDHPFVDGNGRTARALFYWAMCADAYWLMEFISISSVIKKAPSQYGIAFLHTETDENDLTYFIIHQLNVIKKAVAELHEYIARKTKDIEDTQKLLQSNNKLKGKLNFRQLALLRYALKHPRFTFFIDEHKNSHGIAYDTARQDLLTLSDKLKLLEKVKSGKTFVFMTPSNLEDRIKDNA